MISNFDELSKLFEEIDKNLNKKVYFYVIGGAMLLYHGIKPSTKDIDIIVAKKSEFKETHALLRKLRFIAKMPTIEYKQVELNEIFVREDFRIDLFHRTVCKGFQLSDAMIKRVEKVLRLKNLSISLCAPEDVFLFKTLTEREGDIEDCLKLAAQKNLDWNTLLKEIQNQIKISGRNVWITWVGERLDILEERGLVIPIMSAVNKMREEYFDYLDKK